MGKSGGNPTTGYSSQCLKTGELLWLRVFVNFELIRIISKRLGNANSEIITQLWDRLEKAFVLDQGGGFMDLEFFVLVRCLFGHGISTAQWRQNKANYMDQLTEKVAWETPDRKIAEQERGMWS